MSQTAEQREQDYEDDEAVSVDIDTDEDDGPSSVLDDQDDDSNEEELSSYSKNVKNRINQLTQKRRQAMEEAQAAYQYAQQVKAENEQIRQRLQQLDQGYTSEYASRIASQEAQAKRVLAEAHEAGDYDRVADAQTALSQIAIEKERLRLQKLRSEQEANQAKVYAQQQAAYAQQAQQRPAPQQDQRLQKWLSKNTWFNQDPVMTNVARVIHESVVDEGFDPNSDDYYAEIDRRMRRELPHKFKGERKNATSVTPASNGRTARGRKQKVELTPGQVAFAKKMKIPLEKYAQEVAKLANRSD